MDKRIYLTVDTECHDYNKKNQYLIGETKDGKYGIERIMRLGQECGIPVNIFLDIPECHRYGDDHIKEIVDLANKYNHPVFFHLHPDFIFGDNRKHLWEYSKEEQKELFETGVKDYFGFCGKKDRIIFRAGAYGVNKETYEMINELGYDVIDLSFVNKSPFRCKLKSSELKSQNAARVFEGVIVQPNTTYIGYDYFNKPYAFPINVPGTTINEFKRILSRNSLHNIVYTMHSWDLLKTWFFLPNVIRGDKMMERRLKKCINIAKNKGYVFSNLLDYEYYEEEDQCLNLCSGLSGKVIGGINNFRRFQIMGRSYKKYALIYFLPLIIVLIIIALLLGVYLI